MSILKSCLSQALVLLFVCVLLSSCGQPAAPTGALNKDAGKVKTAAEPSGDDDFDGVDPESTSPAGKKSPAAAARQALSTAGKKTGKMLDGLVLHQQNEFLGTTTLKVSKTGARLESSLLTVILIPGQQPVAYNVQNGSTMKLTTKSAAIMAGARQSGDISDVKTESKKLGAGKIAGINCSRYLVQKYATNVKTGYRSRVWFAEIWATRELHVHPAVLKECARFLLIPEELGFPLRVVRFTSPTEIERHEGVTASRIQRDVIKTASCARQKLDEGEFAYLSGFKSVKNEMELMMTSTDEDLDGGELDEAEPVR
jgi:hypothetical protein